MEEIKQVTEQKIAYDEVLKALERLPEEEKEMILNFMKVDELRNILNTSESADKYSMDLLAFARIYASISDIIQKLSRYITNPESEVDVMMKKYSELDDVEKKNIALNMLGQKEFLKDGREILQEEFDKWEKMNPRTKILSKSLMEFMESIFYSKFASVEFGRNKFGRERRIKITR